MDNLGVAQAAADAHLILDEALRIRRRATEAHAESVERARRDAEGMRQRAILDAARITADAEDLVESWFDEADTELASILHAAQRRAEDLAADAAERAQVVLKAAEIARAEAEADRAEAEADRRRAEEVVAAARADQDRLAVAAAEERRRLLAMARDEGDRLRTEGRRALADGMKAAASERDELLRRASDEIVRRRAQADQELTAEAQRARDAATAGAEALVHQARTEATDIVGAAEAARLETLAAAVRDATTLRSVEAEQIAARIRSAEQRADQMLADAEALAAGLTAEAVAEGQAILARADGAAAAVLAGAEERSAATIEAARREAAQIRLTAELEAARLRDGAMAAAQGFHQEAAKALERLQADLDLLPVPPASPPVPAVVGTQPAATAPEPDGPGADESGADPTPADVLSPGQSADTTSGPEPPPAPAPIVDVQSPVKNSGPPSGAVAMPTLTDPSPPPPDPTAGAALFPDRTPSAFVVPDDLRDLEELRDLEDRPVAFPGGAAPAGPRRRRVTVGGGHRWLRFWRS